MSPRQLLWLCFFAATAAQAATPQQIEQEYVAQASSAGTSYRASAQRGESFYRQRFNISERLPSCATCHGENPGSVGRHAITGKRIEPLAPGDGISRFTDPARVEKWFGRNCKEVVGRPCSAGEKADFIAYLLQVKP